jgi:hypothetical protein
MNDMEPFLQIAKEMKKRSKRSVTFELLNESIGGCNGQYNWLEKKVRLSTFELDKTYLKLQNLDIFFKDKVELGEYILAHEFAHANHFMLPFWGRLQNYLLNKLQNLTLGYASKKSLRKTMYLFSKILLHAEKKAWREADFYLLNKIDDKLKKKYADYCLGTYRNYCKNYYKLMMISQKLSRKCIRFKFKIGFVKVVFDFFDEEKESIYDPEKNELLLYLPELIKNKHEDFKNHLSSVDYLYCHVLFLINNKSFDDMERLLIDEHEVMEVFKHIKMEKMLAK